MYVHTYTYTHTQRDRQKTERGGTKDREEDREEEGREGERECVSKVYFLPETGHSFCLTSLLDLKHLPVAFILKWI